MKLALESSTQAILAVVSGHLFLLSISVLLLLSIALAVDSTGISLFLNRMANYHMESDEKAQHLKKKNKESSS